MSASDRIRRCAQAMAHELGGNHLRFMSVVSVVLFLDESVNNLDQWSAVLDRQLQANYTDGICELRERLAQRADRAREHAR